MWTQENSGRLPENDPAQTAVNPAAQNVDPITAQTPAVTAATADKDNWGRRSFDAVKNHPYRTAAVGALAIAGVVSLIEIPGSGSSTIAGAAYNKAVSNCDDSVLSTRTYPGQIDEILPSDSKVVTTGEAGTFTSGLFTKGKNAVLGGKIDPGVEATIYALIGHPATDSGTQDESNISSAFANAYAQETTANKKADLKAAESFCADDQYALGQTFGYSSAAIGNGETYTQIVPVLNSKGAIAQISATETTANKVYGGVTYSFQNDGNSSGVKGFYEVIEPTDGNGQLDVLGPLQQLPKGNSTTEKGTTGTTNKDTAGSVPMPAATSGKKETKTSTGGGGLTKGGTVNEENSGNGVGKVSGGTGSVNTPGSSPESAQPGSDNSPSGGGSGQESTTSTTEEEESTTTTAPKKSPSSTTTTTTGVVRSTTTTTVPKSTTTTTEAPTTTTTAPTGKGPVPTTDPVWGGQ